MVLESILTSVLYLTLNKTSRLQLGDIFFEKEYSYIDTTDFYEVIFINIYFSIQISQTSFEQKSGIVSLLLVKFVTFLEISIPTNF